MHSEHLKKEFQLFTQLREVLKAESKCFTMDGWLLIIVSKLFINVIQFLTVARKFFTMACWLFTMLSELFIMHDKYFTMYCNPG